MGPLKIFRAPLGSLKYFFSKKKVCLALFEHQRRTLGGSQIFLETFSKMGHPSIISMIDFILQFVAGHKIEKT